VHFCYPSTCKISVQTEETLIRIYQPLNAFLNMCLEWNKKDFKQNLLLMRCIFDSAQFQNKAVYETATFGQTDYTALLVILIPLRVKSQCNYLMLCNKSFFHFSQLVAVFLCRLFILYTLIE
jgi:hypothetical protein